MERLSETWGLVLADVSWGGAQGASGYGDAGEEGGESEVSRCGPVTYFPKLQVTFILTV